MRTFLAAALLAAVLAAGDDPVLARLFRDLDRDGDGRIATAEWRGPVREFDRLDADGDGFLTLKEVRTTRQKPPPRLVGVLGELDGDRDRRLSRAEWAGLAGRFKDFDLDGDGHVARRECYEGRQRDRTEEMNAAFAARDKDRDGKLARREWTGDAAGFRRHDTDRDGAISRAEWDRVVKQASAGVRFWRRLFDRLDADRNGKVSAPEWQAIAAAFDPFDANRDGFLAPPELPASAFPRRWTAYDFARRHDRDGNGKVTREEWRGDDAGFKKLDTNGDGVISAADPGPDKG